MSSQQIQFIKVQNLKFDPENPRFAGSDLLNLSSVEIVNQMIDSEQIIDLINSIGTQGYFLGEPLLVFADSGTNQFFVAEGNRRLAALKLINKEVIASSPSINDLINELPQRPEEVPCIIFDSRDSVLHYLGYRHITGIKAWGSLEKAIYLQQLFEKNLRSSQTEAAALRTLAREIGSNVQTIKKTLCALALYNKDYNSSKDEFFGLQRVGKDDIQFSLLYTAIGYPHIASYVGLENSQDYCLESLNYEHARDLFNWLFMQDEKGLKAVPESRKISTLNAVLSSAEATTVFKETRDLDIAFPLTNGPQEFFDNSIKNMEKTVERINSVIHSGTFIPKESDINNIDRLIESLDDLLRKSKRVLKNSKNDFE